MQPSQGKDWTGALRSTLPYEAMFVYYTRQCSLFRLSFYQWKFVLYGHICPVLPLNGEGVTGVNIVTVPPYNRERV